MKYTTFNEHYNDLMQDELLNNVLWINGFQDNTDFLSNYHFPYFFPLFPLFIEKLQKASKVAIIGDYDCDGVCATSIMIRFLNYLKIPCCYIIGDRFTDGYGMNNSLIDKALAQNASLIITVDNGISCQKEVEYAINRGLDVIVTDHHLPGDSIPNCLIFNPHMEKEMPFKMICGATVALNLVLLSLKHLNISDRFFMYALYELASLATIADSMPLYDINRKMVSTYTKNAILDSLRNPGVKALMSYFNIKCPTATDLAFRLIPILNAPGRLLKADFLVELFTNDNPDISLIDKASALNEQRKKLTKEGMERIGSSVDPINVVYLEDLSEGILGILASKLVENTKKPSFVFTNSDNGIKGSGRSCGSFDLLKHTKETNTPFLSLGGHKEALGISFSSIEDLQLFRKKVCENVSIPEGVCYVLDYHYTSFMQTKKKLNSLEPYGEGFKMPLFVIKGTPLNIRILKEVHSSFSLKINDREESFIIFNHLVEAKEKTFVFSIEKETFAGKTNYKGHVVTIL